MNPLELPKSGMWVYLIINRMNGKIYVGKSKRLYHRCHQYIYDFRERSLGHINQHLFNAMHKYGLDCFEMFSLEKCDNEQTLAERELFWISYFRTTDRAKGYNLRLDSSTGMVTHPETSVKISNRLRKEWAEGKRSFHADKMRRTWQNSERREAQGKIFSRIKTKWKYRIHFAEGIITMTYPTLKAFGLSNVLANFHYVKSNRVSHKGFLIERIPYAEI